MEKNKTEAEARPISNFNPFQAFAAPKSDEVLCHEVAACGWKIYYRSNYRNRDWQRGVRKVLKKAGKSGMEYLSEEEMAGLIIPVFVETCIVKWDGYFDKNGNTEPSLAGYVENLKAMPLLWDEIFAAANDPLCFKEPLANEKN